MPEHKPEIDRKWGFSGGEYCSNCGELNICEQISEEKSIQLDKDNYFCLGWMVQRLDLTKINKK